MTTRCEGKLLRFRDGSDEKALQTGGYMQALSNPKNIKHTMLNRSRLETTLNIIKRFHWCGNYSS